MRAWSGVLVGLVITGGIQATLIIRAERRAERASVRAVLAELTNARALIRSAREQSRLWKLIKPHISPSARERHEETLGRSTRTPFGTVVAAYVGGRGLTSVITIGDPEPDFVADALAALEKAITYLQGQTMRRLRWSQFW